MKRVIFPLGVLAVFLFSSQGFGAGAGAIKSKVNAANLTELVLSVEKALPTYGNYCGPAWSNAEWNKPRSVTAVCSGAATVAPVDGVDSLCLTHDKAYCVKDPAGQDIADQKLIDGLKTQRPSVKAQLEALDCPPPTLSTSTKALLDELCGAASLPKSVLSTCNQLRSTEKAQAPAAERSVSFAEPASYAAASPSKAGSPSLSKTGGNGAVKLGNAEPQTIKETCDGLRKEMVFIDTAIVGLTAKRKAYAKAMSIKAAHSK